MKIILDETSPSDLNGEKYTYECIGNKNRKTLPKLWIGLNTRSKMDVMKTTLWLLCWLKEIVSCMWGNCLIYLLGPNKPKLKFLLMYFFFREEGSGEEVEREREREREWILSRLQVWSLMWGLTSHLWSWPDLKSGNQDSTDWATQAPLKIIFKTENPFCIIKLKSTYKFFSIFVY